MIIDWNLNEVTKFLDIFIIHDARLKKELLGIKIS